MNHMIHHFFNALKHVKSEVKYKLYSTLTTRLRIDVFIIVSVVLVLPTLLQKHQSTDHRDVCAFLVPDFWRFNDKVGGNHTID